MSHKKQKLELTWIDKDKEPRLEPRILIEDPEKSYGDKNTENMLIHGDNLLALKALEQDYAGMIKCIYIDPPFNTKSRIDSDGKEIGYDDSLEHSIWLNMMKLRINILYKLLTKDGSLIIHLDDNELDYCKIILDEIFLRKNFINRITLDARSPSAFSTVNPGVFKASEYLLWYAKDKENWENRTIKIPTDRDEAYNKFIKNRSENYEIWEIAPLKISFLENLNSDKITLLSKFINSIYNNKDMFKTKSLLEKYLVDEFKYSILIDIKKMINYLFNKLKSCDDEKEFYAYCYPYILEKISYNFTKKDFDNFVIDNAQSVFRETEISDDGAGQETVKLKYESIKAPNKIFCLKRNNNLENIFIINGRQISFYEKNINLIDGKKTPTKLLTNIWNDISWEGIAGEGNVTFKKGKKPEKLIKRIVELNSSENDLVLDSFLGSGTTAAVAHKMGRRWIGIELGDHCNTHCKPRLDKVIDGEQGGISKAVNWKGGGGYKFYELAPSLLKKDKYGQWVIEEKYNPDMLAAAMAKQEGFKYSPHPEIYWKQGKSSEKDFIYTTTQFMTTQMLDKIAEEMGEDETLLICARSFAKGADKKYPGITVKKIPQMLLGRCEFGKDDYSLNIVNLPNTEDLAESEENSEPTLFENEESE